MPGRILTVRGLMRADDELIRDFAAGTEADRALLATRSLLRRWEAKLLAQAPGQALGGGRLLLFEGLARQLVGPTPLTPAGEWSRQAVMAATVDRLAKEGRLRRLGPLAASPALAGDLLISIAELKRGMIPEAELGDLARGRAMLADLALCRREYDTAMRAIHRIDGDDLLALAIEAAAGAPVRTWLARLLVHGFTDFTPLQARLLRVLAEAGVAVTIVLSDARMFAAQDLLHEAVQRQFPGWVKQSGAAAAPASPRVARWAAGLPDIGREDGSVIGLVGEGENALASLIAREIRKRLAEDPTLVFDEIAVVRREPASASPMAEALSRFGVPVREETGPALLSLNGIGTILAALDCVARDWPRASLLRLARGIFVKDAAPMADALKSASARAGITRGRAAWLQLGPATGADAVGAASARAREDALAGQAVASLAACLACIPSRADTAAYYEAVRALVDRCRLAALWWPDGSEESLLTAYADEMRGIELFLSILAEMAAVERELARKKTWEIDAFAAEAARIAAAARLPARPRRRGIRCLNPSEIRGLEFRLVFLVGLAEGEFPKAKTENWLLPEDIRGRLRGPHHWLESRAALAAREWQLLANTIAAAGQTLYLCWSTVDRRGDTLPPSPFLRQIGEALGHFPVVSLHAGELLPRDLSEAWDGASAKGRLLADLLWEELPAERAAAALTAYGRHRLEVAALLARASEAGTRQEAGVLHAADILAGLDRTYGATRVIGVSALEDYALCPFVFYCRRLLGLEPVPPADEAPAGLDLGLAYHKSLERFFRRTSMPLKAADLPLYERQLRQDVDEAFGAIKAAAKTPVAARLVELARQTCRERLTAFIRAETRRTARGKAWYASHCELGFGLTGRSGLDPASIPDPLVLGEGAAAVRVAGKIDRLDELAGDYYAIYDYKLGRPPTPADVLNGRTLQIPIYLLAAERLFPNLTAAGGGYYSLRDLSRQVGLWRAELADLTGISPRAGGSLPEAEWRAAMVQLTEKALAVARGIRAGDFSPTSEDCPSYCEFKAICRKEAR
ncbi:MAG: PD-(D/E)XK nuclease family protein [Bacteroidota bacterium]